MSKSRNGCPESIASIFLRLNRTLSRDENNFTLSRKIGFSKDQFYYNSIIELFDDFESFVSDVQPYLQIAYDNYFCSKGYDAVRDIDLIVWELPEALLEMDFGVLGLSEDQEDEFMLAWIERFAAKHDLDLFEDLNYSVQEEIEILERLVDSLQSDRLNSRTATKELLRFEAKVVYVNGQITVALPRLLEEIEKVDKTRIRICTWCKRFFWAARTDSKACNESCRNSARQRRFLGLNRDIVNAKRRANYYHKNRKK